MSVKTYLKGFLNLKRLKDQGLVMVSYIITRNFLLTPPPPHFPMSYLNFQPEAENSNRTRENEVEEGSI